MNDKKRIDWLWRLATSDHGDGESVDFWTGADGVVRISLSSGTTIHEGASIREAIDAAMEYGAQCQREDCSGGK